MSSATSDKRWSPDYRIAIPGTRLSPQEVLDALTAAAGDAFISGRIADWTENPHPAPEAPAAPAEGDAPAAEPAPAAPASPTPAFRQVWLDLRADGKPPRLEIGAAAEGRLERGGAQRRRALSGGRREALFRFFGTIHIVQYSLARQQYAAF